MCSPMLYPVRNSIPLAVGGLWLVCIGTQTVCCLYPCCVTFILIPAELSFPLTLASFPIPIPFLLQGCFKWLRVRESPLATPSPVHLSFPGQASGKEISLPLYHTKSMELYGISFSYTWVSLSRGLNRTNLKCIGDLKSLRCCQRKNTRPIIGSFGFSSKE